MSTVSILALSVALALDAFAASLAIGAMSVSISRKRMFRVALTFGGFQGVMPVLGWIFGNVLLGPLSRVDHWIAFAVLVAVGVHMIISALRGRPALSSDPTHGWLLLGLAVATSIDALAAGFSLALVRSSIFLPAVSIGVITAAMSATALCVGRRAGRRLGRWAELAGGITLIVIATQILVRHLSEGI